MLNVLVGVFVDTSITNSADDQKRLDQELQDIKNQKALEVSDIFRSIDADGSGSLSWEEFSASLSDPRVQGLFACPLLAEIELLMRALTN